ncbi:MAG TPA: hypothetical protein VK870_08450 [Ignavibacteriaceae bacterium]|nr:hypothetical protein [Ignavibacteriaceae bacterium]
MKLVSYKSKKSDRVGILYEDKIFDLEKSASALKIELPSTMKEFLEGETKSMKLAKKVYDVIKNKKIKSRIKLNDVTLLAPVPEPPSMRDG